jgi:hypothetical protein
VDGVVSYAWSITTKNGFRWAFGTMNLTFGNGFAGNPWCGVLKGSVTITETTDAVIPIDCAPWFVD